MHGRAVQLGLCGCREPSGGRTVVAEGGDWMSHNTVRSLRTYGGQSGCNAGVTDTPYSYMVTIVYDVRNCD